jgi:hypothetical protein
MTMGSKKSFVKGLAAGAVLGAVASLMMSMKDSGKEQEELSNAANDVKDRVMKHAKKLGSITRSGYARIVDTTVGEYRGAKALSEDELKELKRELLQSWGDVRTIVTSAMKDLKKKKPVAKKAGKGR